MENQSFGQRVATTTKKILKRLLIFTVIIGVILLAFFYWGTYDDGILAGKVLRVSERGYLFKTYEGKINLETFGALKGASPIAESFDFSIEKNDKDIIKQLEEVALTGERVNLHYVKRYGAFPWRGETRYFVNRVERLGQK